MEHTDDKHNQIHCINLPRQNRISVIFTQWSTERKNVFGAVPGRDPAAPRPPLEPTLLPGSGRSKRLDLSGYLRIPLVFSSTVFSQFQTSTVISPDSVFHNDAQNNTHRHLRRPFTLRSPLTGPGPGHHLSDPRLFVCQLPGHPHRMVLRLKIEVDWVLG